MGEKSSAEYTAPRKSRVVPFTVIDVTGWALSQTTSNSFLKDSCCVEAMRLSYYVLHYHQHGQGIKENIRFKSRYFSD
jgi:hypothetical protein